MGLSLLGGLGVCGLLIRNVKQTKLLRTAVSADKKAIFSRISYATTRTVNALERNGMLVPQQRTVWNYVGPGSGRSRLHMVLDADDLEVTTMSFAQDVRGIDHTGIWETKDWLTNFKYVAGPLPWVSKRGTNQQ